MAKKASKKAPKRTVARANTKPASKPRAEAPESTAGLAYNARNGLTPEGIQIAHADGTPTQAFMDSEDERAAREALAAMPPIVEIPVRGVGWLGRPINGSNGINPVFDDLERADILKKTENWDGNVTPVAARMRELLADASARLEEFTHICDATLEAFNAGAVTEDDRLKTFEDIPKWVKDMMGLLEEASAAPSMADFDRKTIAEAFKERDWWKEVNANNVKLANEHLATAQHLEKERDLALQRLEGRPIEALMKERDAANSAAQRWEKEREAALQSARVHRETADAAVKELRNAQQEADFARKEVDNLRKAFQTVESSLSALQVQQERGRDADLDAAVTVAKAFEAMVADEAAVLDLTACSEETTSAVAAAMAVLGAA